MVILNESSLKQQWPHNLTQIPQRTVEVKNNSWRWFNLRKCLNPMAKLGIYSVIMLLKNWNKEFLLARDSLELSPRSLEASLWKTVLWTYGKCYCGGRFMWMLTPRNDQESNFYRTKWAEKSLVADFNICRGSGGLKKIIKTRFDKKGTPSSRTSLIKD